MLKKFVTVFVLLISVYVVGLTMVYSFDSTRVNLHVNNGIALLENEKLWPNFFFNNSAGMIDNFTDRVMLTKAVAEDKSQSALEKSMHMNGYARYWHGYQVILRPLLVLFKYTEIRYISSFIVFGLLFWSLNILKNKVNLVLANIFLFSLCCCKLFLIPMSMQFMNMTLLMFIAIGITDKYCLKNDPIGQCDFEKFYLCSFIIGSLTAFLDLLTTPLLPIGVTILFSVIYLEEIKKVTLTNKFLIWNLFDWCIGYICTWATKWIIATLVTPNNIIINAINQVMYRTGSKFALSEGGNSVSKLEALKLNFKMLFLPLGNTKIILLIALVMLIFVLLWYYFRKNNINNSFVKRVLFISFLPQAWYFVTANHSQLHHWFTYRSQVVTLMGCLYLMYYFVDWGKVKLYLVWRKKNV